MREAWQTNRDLKVQSRREKMRQSGAGLKKIEAFAQPRKRVKVRRGGVRGEFYGRFS